MIMPANFSIATLFPELAIRPNLPALPFSDVEKLEKTSFYSSQLLHCPWFSTLTPMGLFWGVEESGAYRTIYHILTSRIVVDIDCYAS